MFFEPMLKEREPLLGRGAQVRGSKRPSPSDRRPTFQRIAASPIGKPEAAIAAPTWSNQVQKTRLHGACGGIHHISEIRGGRRSRRSNGKHRPGAPAPERGKRNVNVILIKLMRAIAACVVERTAASAAVAVAFVAPAALVRMFERANQTRNRIVVLRAPARAAAGRRVAIPASVETTTPARARAGGNRR